MNPRPALAGAGARVDAGAGAGAGAGAAGNALQPQRPPTHSKIGRAALLALLAHAGLIAALSVGLNWRLSPPPVVYAAELWASTPQMAAPAPVEPQPVATTPPPPTPRAPPEPRPAPEAVMPDAQIGIEKAQRQKKLAMEREAQAQRQRLAREEQARQAKLHEQQLKDEQRKKELAAQREAQAAEARLVRQREANLARIQGQAGATGAATDTGSAARDAAPSATYAGRIKARIKPNIVLTADVTGNPITEIEVRCASDGAIVGRRIVKPSGNSVWDETVLRAIDRTEVLPRDVDGRVPTTMILVFPRRE